MAWPSQSPDANSTGPSASEEREKPQETDSQQREKKDQGSMGLDMTKTTVDLTSQLLAYAVIIYTS